MNDLRRQLYELTGRQHGLASLEQARAIGYTAAGARSLKRSAEFDALTNDVVRHRAAPRTDAQRLMAAVLDAGGDAAISHMTAASWWGLEGCTRWPVTLTTTRSSQARTTLAVTHEVRSLPPTWSVRHEGIPIVRPELLALQLFAICGRRRATRLVDRLWSERLLSGRSIRRFLAQMGARGRNGTAGLRIYYNERGDDYVPPATGLEGRVMELLDEHGIEMRRQVDSGEELWTGRVDFRHVELPVILEVQSEKYHRSLSSTADDAARHIKLERDGFTYTEIWDTDVWARPWSVGPAVEAAIATARSSPRNP